MHGQHIPIARTTVTPGGMQALYFALELLVDTGTNVVYVAPQWPNIHNAIHLIGGEPRPFALDFDGDWRLDLERLFAPAMRARAPSSCRRLPTRPDGRRRREELLALLEFSRRTGIWIISDEVYGRLYFDDVVAPSILQVAEDGDRVLSVNSFSKAWAMTGWRIGWLTHPSGVADQLGAMTQFANSGTSGPVQAGAVAAIRQGEPLVQEIRQRIKTGLDLAYDRLAQIPGIVLPAKPRGGMYAFFALEGESDAAPRCAPTYWRRRASGWRPAICSDSRRKAFMRMCVCRERAQIATALERMLDTMN